SGHYLASQIGLMILEAGGNAVDAGVAAGLAINVAQCELTNLGGVAPIMIYSARSNELVTISGLGTWPRAASAEWVRARGHTSIPLGILSSIVPAAVDAWLTALARYGTMSFAQVAAPALELAERGCPVTRFFYDNVVIAQHHIEATPYSRDLLLPGGRP